MKISIFAQKNLVKSHEVISGKHMKVLRTHERHCTSFTFYHFHLLKHRRCIMEWSAVGLGGGLRASLGDIQHAARLDPWTHCVLQRRCSVEKNLIKNNCALHTTILWLMEKHKSLLLGCSLHCCRNTYSKCCSRFYILGWLRCQI